MTYIRLFAIVFRRACMWQCFLLYWRCFYLLVGRGHGLTDSRRMWSSYLNSYIIELIIRTMAVGLGLGVSIVSCYWMNAAVLWCVFDVCFNCANESWMKESENGFVTVGHIFSIVGKVTTLSWYFLLIYSNTNQTACGTAIRPVLLGINLVYLAHILNFPVVIQETYGRH